MLNTHELKPRRVNDSEDDFLPPILLNRREDLDLEASVPGLMGVLGRIGGGTEFGKVHGQFGRWSELEGLEDELKKGWVKTIWRMVSTRMASNDPARPTIPTGLSRSFTTDDGDVK